MPGVARHVGLDVQKGAPAGKQQPGPPQVLPMHATPACGGQGAPASPPPTPVVLVTVVVVVAELELLPVGQQSCAQLKQSSPAVQFPSPHIAQTPQSPGQPAQFSPKIVSQRPLPQQAAQSSGQLWQFSTPVQLPSPHPTQTPQSSGHVMQFSLKIPSQEALPQQLPQSVAQLAQFSPKIVSHEALPQHAPQSPAHVLQFSAPLHMRSPQNGQDPQSDWQFMHVSPMPGLHDPSPQPWHVPFTQPAAHSQPFDVIPSQFVKPASHCWIWQAPVPHDSVACGRSQTTPQSPQSCSVWIDFSQPSSNWPLQFLKPELQVMLHMNEPHDAVPLMLAHVVPQLPQLRALLWRLASHPFAAVLSQLAKGALHEPIWHWPEAQAAPALGKLHWFGHVPQWSASVKRLTSHPSATPPLQLPKGTLQFWIVQAPATHAPTPFAGAQSEPHAPQLPRLVSRLASQPSLGMLLQSAQPGSHPTIWQVPVPHEVTAWERVQTVPQLVQ